MLVKHRLPVSRFGRREVSPPRNPTKASVLSMAAAWQVRGLAGFGEPCLRFGDAPLGRLKALPQRPDWGVPPGVAQVAEVGELGHTAMKIDPAVTASSAFLQASRCAGRSSPQRRLAGGMSNHQNSKASKLILLIVVVLGHASPCF